MFRSFAAAILVSCFAAAGWAQSPSTANAPAASTPAKAVTKKAAPKAKAAAKQPVAAETGPCRLGVISALEDRFAVQKFGLTIFETEESAVTVEGWGLDDLVVARIRAATGTDPAVRRITYPRGAFEPFYNPTSRFLPDPREGLPAIVRSITPAANCERYLVVTRFKGQVPGTNLMLDGVGAYSRGLGSVVRHSHLFANIGMTLLDGGSYETIGRPFAGLGTRLTEGLRLTEDPLTKLDNSLFPEPATAVPGNAMLRERTRALVAARLDQTLPDYLKND
ncbi:hypothetical protein CQ13_05490 [Bradyrhizobium retamae]|uniref:Uncharacterized protein n=1 Tax=Bradyrhizobium retamae TaxID=1300035 RepID=A0A0R3MTK6_9BRAD|nr:hypothetical protein CQ13_05490 [Bradyrhizobium retamae]